MTTRQADTARPAGITRRLRTALSSALLVLLGSAVTLVVAAGPAAAHDVLVSTSPANGATVAQTPSQVVITFTDPALSIGTQVVVTGPAGPVGVPAPRLVDNTVVQDLPGSSPAGHYSVSWRVTSADGHPVSGEFSFTSHAPSPPSTVKAPVAATPTPVAQNAPSASGSALPVVAIFGVLVVVVILATAVVVVGRRRRQGASND